MLLTSKQMDETSREVNMAIAASSGSSAMYRLVDRDLFRRLMCRTGDGRKVSHRDLAEAAKCATGTIGFLLNGTQEAVPMEVAHGITRRLGIGVLVLFEPPHCADVPIEHAMAVAS